MSVPMNKSIVVFIAIIVGTLVLFTPPLFVLFGIITHELGYTVIVPSTTMKDEIEITHEKNGKPIWQCKAKVLSVKFSTEAFSDQNMVVTNNCKIIWNQVYKE